MGRGSWARCDRCDGAGYIDFGDEWEGGSREDCTLCDSLGIVEFPLTHAKVYQVLELLEEEGDYLTDGYECVADLVEGTCQHCADLAAAEYSWMAEAVVAHRKAGHRCNPYSAEGCHCDVMEVA